MFKGLFNKKSDQEEIYAPITGAIIPLDKVPDPVFSQKMMGDGMAILPSKGIVVSPVDGKVVHLPDSKHAVGLKTAKGTELLIHVGLETVALKGEGFTAKVQEGDMVAAGDELIQFDLDYIRANADDIVTPIIWTNGKDSDKQLKLPDEQTAVAGETKIMIIA